MSPSGFLLTRGVLKVTSPAMWIAAVLYFSLKRPLTVVGPPQVVASPTTRFAPLFRSISGASANEAESIPSVSGIGLGDLTMQNGVGAFNVKSWVAVGLASL